MKTKWSCFSPIATTEQHPRLWLTNGLQTKNSRISSSHQRERNKTCELNRQEPTGEKNQFTLNGIGKPFDSTRTRPGPTPSKTTASRNMLRRPFPLRRRISLTCSLAFAWLPVANLPILKIIGKKAGTLYLEISKILSGVKINFLLRNHSTQLRNYTFSWYEKIFLKTNILNIYEFAKKLYPHRVFLLNRANHFSEMPILS